MPRAISPPDSASVKVGCDRGGHTADCRCRGPASVRESDPGSLRLSAVDDFAVRCLCGFSPCFAAACSERLHAPPYTSAVTDDERESPVAARLAELGIPFERHEHPAVATVEEAVQHWDHIH